MRREDVDREMEELVGTSLGLLDRVADEFLTAEWDLLKRLQFGETLIPNRYKELIGLAVAAAARCPYGVILHQELARVYGATDGELAEVVHWARLVSGWGTHLAGLQIDVVPYSAEVRLVADHLARQLGVETDREGSVP